nr:MAG TPA: hypothetical protein [Caudoviricetes sp.]
MLENPFFRISVVFSLHCLSFCIHTFSEPVCGLF